MLYPIFRGPFPWKQDNSAKAEAEPEAEAESGRRLERGLEGESWGPLQAAYITSQKENEHTQPDQHYI